MTLRHLLFFFIAIFPIASIAKLDLCNEHLDPKHYEFGSRVTPTDEIAQSRRPEPQSLEDRKPGIAKAIFAIAQSGYQPSLWNHGLPLTNRDASRIMAELHLVVPALMRLPDQFQLSENESQRFFQTAIEIDEFVERGILTYNRILPAMTRPVLYSTVRLAQDMLFELMISTFFEGKQFVFHTEPIFHYGDKQAKHNGGLKIDIIVERPDGRHIWLTVKNNGFDWAIPDYHEWAQQQGMRASSAIDHFHTWLLSSRFSSVHEKSVGPQVRQQRIARDKLGLSNYVDILVVSRYPFSESAYSSIAKQTAESWPLYLMDSSTKSSYFRNLTRMMTAN